MVNSSALLSTQLDTQHRPSQLPHPGRRGRPDQGPPFAVRARPHRRGGTSATEKAQGFHRHPRLLPEPPMPSSGPGQALRGPLPWYRGSGPPSPTQLRQGHLATGLELPVGTQHQPDRRLVHRRGKYLIHAEQAAMASNAARDGAAANDALKKPGSAIRSAHCREAGMES